MDKTLKVAHCVESYFPSKGGMPEVVRQLSERIAAKGMDVTVFTSFHPDRNSEKINGVNIRSFPISGNYVQGIKPDTGKYFQELKDGNFDVVVLFAAQQWATDSIIDRLNEIPGKKIFVPTGFSHFHNPAYSDYFEKMKTWMHAFDANVFLSENYTDINFARENGITKNVIIPNGAAEEEFEKESKINIRERFGIKKEELLVLHVGSYTGIKGHREALDIFIRSSVKNAVLLLVGDKNHYLEKAFKSHYSYFPLRIKNLFRKKKINIVELTREESVAAFLEADLFLFPSNVECSPIVLFEAMAAGVPFLASSAGNSEEIVKWSHGGWILPCGKTENGWTKIRLAESIEVFEKVCADKKLLKETGQEGKKAWKEKFTWSGIAEQYLDLYRKLIEQK